LKSLPHILGLSTVDIPLLGCILYINPEIVSGFAYRNGNIAMSNENKRSDNHEDRPKVYVRSINKIATVRKVENDPVWGPQYLVSTYSREWGPDFFWVKGDDVDEIKDNRGTKRS
jgi:hypothetical protein